MYTIHNLGWQLIHEYFNSDILFIHLANLYYIVFSTSLRISMDSNTRLANFMDEEAGGQEAPSCSENHGKQPVRRSYNGFYTMAAARETRIDAAVVGV